MRDRSLITVFRAIYMIRTNLRYAIVNSPEVFQKEVYPRNSPGEHKVPSV